MKFHSRALAPLSVPGTGASPLAGRRAVLAALAALAGASLLPACERAPPLRIASYVWPGYEFMFLAQREGWIAARDTALVETGSASESIRILAEGQADGAALTLDELLRARAQGLPLTAVLVFDISLGADVLLARPELVDLAGLKGRRIGYEPSGVGALMLHKALAAAGLSRAEVRTVPVTFDHHLQAWRAREVDALITFEPAASHLLAEGARLLFDSSRIPDTIFDVLAVLPGVLEHQRAALSGLVAAHFRGQANFRKNPNDTAYRMADRFKLTAKEVIAAYRGLELPNEAHNRRLLDGQAPILVKAAGELAGELVRAGLEKTPPSLAGLVDAGFIPREEPR
jgi:NitT/TauT family transport system substrate-binding protein